MPHAGNVFVTGGPERDSPRSSRPTPDAATPTSPTGGRCSRTAEQQVDLLGYSLSQITHTAQYKQLLTDKATAGCQIRIAIAEPNSPVVHIADRDNRPPGRLINRIEATYHQLLDLNDPPRIEVRRHQVATSHTILRFDDTILLTIHLHATPGFEAPLIHLRRDHDYGLFDQLAKHVEDVWQAAGSLARSQDTEPSTAASLADAERERFLDSLDTP